MSMRTPLRQEVWDTTNGRCFYCRQNLGDDETLTSNELQMHVDHKIPRVRGGMDIAENRAPACFWCNCQKNKKTVAEYHDYLLKLNILPQFLDKEIVARDWLMVVTVRGKNDGKWRSTGLHPHRRVSNA